MTKEEKTAFVRIIIDLIKADDILDISEMEFIQQVTNTKIHHPTIRPH